MRIGIVTGEYPPMRGGVGAYTRILARHLATLGHEVFLFSGCTAETTEFPLEKTTHWNFATLRAITRWFDRERLHVINLQYQTAAYHLSPWIHLLPVIMRYRPIVVTFHDLKPPYLFPKAGPLRDQAVKQLARQADGVIVTNDEDAQALTDVCPAELIPIGSNILAPLPADYHPQPWRERVGAGSHDYLLAYFGLINHSKGLDTLLISMARLHAERIPAHLVMIGDELGSSDASNADYRARFEAEIDRHNLRPYIHQTGYLEDERAVGSFLKAADAVVLPFRDGASYRRGTLMAAIYYGCPIVTTTPRVHIPLFIDRKNMLLVPPDAPDALTSALRSFRHDVELRDRLRLEAANLKHLFEWSQIATLYSRYLATVVERAG
jgi:glycosyltransferase involved in cell wall biosynthesis